MNRMLEYARRYEGVSQTAPGPTPPEMFSDITLHLVVRLAGFRERFFGTGSGAALEASYLAQRQAGVKENGVAVNVQQELQWLNGKLAEFESWWQAHRTDPVQLPTPAATPATSPTP